MSSPASNNWWNMAGTYGSSSGIRIDESTALTHTAVLAATRVIAGTLAGLPCNLIQQVDARTTKSATKHPLWKLIHDEPNHEQDIKSWLESQVAFQLNWGNAYAEIQRNSLGEVVALWPIHPSRIPLKNILRNGTSPIDYDGIVAGQPGELVYYVNNDDGSKTAIPASDMLHVPGMLSTNGITGQSIVKWGANAIGIAIATEMHAGALFKNGAMSNIVITSPKTVGKDAAERLRNQWQSTFSGVQNHYKTLLLEEGMTVTPINMDPETTQLLDARRFSKTDIATLYGVPPHMIGDLSNATFSNIESQGLSFVVYTMMYWIVGWEKAMQRQLLTSEEKKSYRFKFNVNGLLRGDSASRGQLYQILFNLGAFSPNDIRALEDYNPIEGGDQYFVQGNNCVPLDTIGEISQANLDKLKAPPPPPPAPPQVQPPVPPEQTDAVDNLAHIAGLRKEMFDRMAEHETSLPEQIAVAVNTRAADEANRRESAAKDALQAVNDALRLAIQGEADQLMRYEARAAREAARKPSAFPNWQTEFYPKFSSKLSSALSVFAPAAEKIGVVINGASEADAYVLESMAAFESLFSLPLDQFESGVDQMVERWADRPKELAESLFSKGSAV